MKSLPRVFDMLQYFKSIFPSVKSLAPDLPSKVRDIYGWWRYWRPVKAPTIVAYWPPYWISPRIRNEVKIAINGNFFCLTCKITLKQDPITPDTNKHFVSFHSHVLLLLLKIEA